MEIFNKRIRELRLESGLSQKDLAVLLHTEDKLISDYESAIVQPTLEKLCDYAYFFEVSTDYLLGRTNERNKVFKV